MKKVLIVDDEFEFVNDLAKGLEIFGFSASKAGDGASAINMIDKIKPDIVLFGYDQQNYYDNILIKFLNAHRIYPRSIRLPKTDIVMHNGVRKNYKKTAIKLCHGSQTEESPHALSNCCR